jgi:hypothetical protein
MQKPVKCFKLGRGQLTVSSKNVLKATLTMHWDATRAFASTKRKLMATWRFVLVGSVANRKFIKVDVKNIRRQDNRYMNRTVQHILLCVFFLLVSCNHGNDLVVINVQESALDHVGISEIAEKVTAIPLETNPDCLLGGVYSLRKTDSLLFILSGGEIFLFDITGKFIKKIIHRGRGPGEMPFVRDFDLNEGDREVVAIGSGNYILHCKYDGTVVRQLQYKHPNYTIMAFSIFAGRIWVIAWGKASKENGGYNICLLTLDQQWQTLDSTSLYKPDLPFNSMGFGHNYFSVTGEEFFVNVPSLTIDRARRDTLYRIDPDLQLVPVLRLDFGYSNYRVSSSREEYGYPLDFEAIRINQRFLIVPYYVRRERVFTFYTFCYDFHTKRKYNLEEGFNDNLHNTGYDTYIQPVDVHHNECYFSRETDELPADYLPKRSESDNPVLFIITLKK